MPAGHSHQKVNIVTRNELNLTQNMCLPVQEHFRKLCVYFPILNFSMVCLFENNILNSIIFATILRRNPCFPFKTTHRENKMGAIEKKTQDATSAKD